MVAGIAQLVEHLICNQRVGSSSLLPAPFLPDIYNKIVTFYRATRSRVTSGDTRGIHFSSIVQYLAGGQKLIHLPCNDESPVHLFLKRFDNSLEPTLGASHSDPYSCLDDPEDVMFAQCLTELTFGIFIRALLSKSP